ncbi:hypothetical protein Bca52824_079157 [Brassica carinata]|uniref:rRNA biogenesis protein RRP36 n=1 Tax=Brassica carinata TaxID=52824 RepID=A0A8X7Q0L1_BRACI|nr:hypothetical protein Bca52824_079157 [Brassica carinata]
MVLFVICITPSLLDLSRRSRLPPSYRFSVFKGVSKFEPSSSKIVFDDSEDDEDEQSLSSMSSSDEEEEEEEEKGKELTLEEIHRLRADGSRPRPAVPVKPSFSQVKKNTGRAADKNITFSEAKKPARANKNRPMELSSKRPVSRFREVIQAPKKVVRDPRFDSLAGNVDPEGFRKRYSFFFEEKLPVEREELKKKLKKTKNPEDVEELKDQLTYVEKLLKYDPSTNSKGKSILTEHKKKEREAAKMGKKPYYLKQSEIRKQELIEKYNSLKESGKLSSFLDKRRKKNATKDHSALTGITWQDAGKVELVDGSSYLAQPLPFSISTLIRIKVLVTGYIEFQHNAELYSEASVPINVV